MVKTTAAQRTALKRLFDRAAIFHGGQQAEAILASNGWHFTYEEDTCRWTWAHPLHGERPNTEAADVVREMGYAQPMSYLSFRRRVEPTFGCDDAIAVPFAGMWVCVEKDGYAHS